MASALSTEVRGMALAPPSAAPTGHPVSFETSDGVILEGTFRRHPAARATVVVVHGFSAGREEAGVRRLVDLLSASGYGVFSYDARGHGVSGGLCGVGSTEHLDVQAAVSSAVGDGLPVVLVGVSMGGVAVTRLLRSLQDGSLQGDASQDGSLQGDASQDGSLQGDASQGSSLQVAGAVLVSSPARWHVRISPISVLTALFTRTPLGRWVAERHLKVRISPRWEIGETPESMLTQVSLPVAVVHGGSDRLLSPDHAYRLRLASKGPGRLEVVEEMGHGLDEHGCEAAVRGVEWVLQTAA